MIWSNLATKMGNSDIHTYELRVPKLATPFASNTPNLVCSS